MITRTICSANVLQYLRNLDEVAAFLDQLPWGKGIDPIARGNARGSIGFIRNELLRASAQDVAVEQQQKDAA